MESYFAIANTIETLEAVKININSYHHRWFQQALNLGIKIGVHPTLPRIATSMQHRSNIPGKDEEEYFRRNITIPCFDHVIF